jgi:radical SAM superfamily enzyme YgiQ (UPF0313 family)
MRMLLVNAWEKGCAETNFLSPPVGLWRLKSYLDAKHNDIAIEVFDPNLYANPYLELDKSFNSGAFDIIGFSPLYMTLENDLSLMLYLQEKNPDALFIAGGQQAGFDRGPLFRHSPVQVVVVGEGERPMRGILEAVENRGLDRVRRDLSLLVQVPGLYLKNIDGPESDGKTAHLPPLDQAEFTEATFLTDFKSIPVGQYWDLLARNYTAEQLHDTTILKKIYTLKPFTSSFCPYRCIFCSSTNFYKIAAGCNTKIASLSPGNLSKYVKLLLKNQPLTRTILFKDDNFFVRHSSKDVKGILVKLAELRKEFPFLSFAAKARIDTFSKQPDLFEMCRDAGFFFISFGVESFSEKELRYMAKGIDPSTSKWVLKKAQDLGINSVAYVILTTPVSEVKDIFMTVDGSIDLIAQGNTVKVFPYLIPIPGSALAGCDSAKNLTVKERFRVPGYDLEIEKGVRVDPGDNDARELMAEFSRRIGEESEQWKSEVGGAVHFVSEVSTLIKFRLLYKIAAEKRFVSLLRASQKIDEIEALIAKNRKTAIEDGTNEMVAA